jgi:hypothetical protein
MEHQLNHSPDIGARVFKIGLRKRSVFLAIPPFVSRYAQLLLVLGNKLKLRALFMRAVAVCEAQEKEDVFADVWDRTL